MKHRRVTILKPNTPSEPDIYAFYIKYLKIKAWSAQNFPFKIHSREKNQK